MRSAEEKGGVSLLAEIVGRVDTDVVARRMVAAFRDEIEAYRRLPDAVAHGQIADISRTNLELFFETLVHARPLTDEELLPFRDSARLRAGEGLPLEDLLHAYRLGGRLGWEALVEAATPPEQTALLPSVAALMAYVDRVSDAVTETYHDERRHLMSTEERRLHDLLEGLLTGIGIEPDLRQVAEQIGLPLVDRYRPFALRLTDPRPYAHSQLAATLRQQGRLALVEGDRVAGLAVDETGVPGIDGKGTLAIGEPARPGALAAALDDARALLELADGLGLEGRLSVSDHLPELLLSRSPQLGAALARRALGPLDDYAAARRSSDLLDTLEVFMDAELDRRAAALRLHVHPNTLDYRLRRIEELTDLDLGRPNDLALLSLALKQRRLSGK